MLSCVNLERHKTGKRGRRGKKRGKSEVGGGVVCVCVSGSGNGQQGGGMWNISDAAPVAVYTVVSPWHQSPDFINVSRRKNEQLANSCTVSTTSSHRFSETESARPHGLCDSFGCAAVCGYTGEACSCLFTVITSEWDALKNEAVIFLGSFYCDNIDR